MYSPFTKKTHFYIILILILVSSTHCSKKLKVNSSELLQPYNDQQIALIQDNWKQYFKENIFTVLAPEKDVFPIGLDSYGAIYANDTLFQEFDEDNFAAGLPYTKDKIKNIATVSHSDNDLNKYSMFQIFHWEGNASKLKASIGALKNNEDQNFYSSILDQYSLAPGYNGKKMKRTSVEFYHYIDGFYEQWNAYHLTKTNQKLINVIEKGKPDRILFFVHGYNVPYSLAVMQSIELNEYILSIQEELNNPCKVLFVPVFWSSNDQKKSELDTDEKVKMGDEVKISNAIKWGFYSTRANFAGLGLRQILHRLEASTSELPEQLIFSHSLGAVVVTSALINATSRLSGDYSALITNDKCGGVLINDSIQNKLEEKENSNYKLFQKFNTVPLPKSNIRVFMSAPAISGVETFKDMCEEEKLSKAFFSTVNSKDLTLKKFVGIVDGLGCTSLGLNDKCDVMQTKIDYFWDQGYYFYNKEDIEISQHGIFDYMLQPPYRGLVKDFLAFEFPVD